MLDQGDSGTEQFVQTESPNTEQGDSDVEATKNTMMQAGVKQRPLPYMGQVVNALGYY